MTTTKKVKGFMTNIEKVTRSNTNFRKVLYTAKHIQLVLMTLLPQQEIGLETHFDNDQFFRFEEGVGKCVMNGRITPIKSGSAVIVPAGSAHNIINTSKTKPLKLYTLYCPPHHQDKIIRKTKLDAEKRDAPFDGKTTE